MDLPHVRFYIHSSGVAQYLAFSDAKYATPATVIKYCGAAFVVEIPSALIKGRGNHNSRCVRRAEEGLRPGGGRAGRWVAGRPYIGHQSATIVRLAYVRRTPEITTNHATACACPLADHVTHRPMTSRRRQGHPHRARPSTYMYDVQTERENSGRTGAADRMRKQDPHAGNSRVAVPTAQVIKYQRRLRILPVIGASRR